MSKRIQSPSSVNLYKQCPRKYYYQYIEKLSTKPSIYLIRGSIAHKVLEDFYDIEELEEEYNLANQLLKRLLSLLKTYWEESHEELHKLGLSDADLKGYFTETQLMLANWFNQFWAKYQSLRESGLDSHDAFKKIIPIREELFESEEVGARGYIDVIENDDGICLMDYKTSKSDEMSAAYKLQLSIYAYLYYLKHSILPKKVGIYFLRHGTKTIDVTQELIKEAQFELEQIHMLTETDDIEEYPQKTSGLCKWANGECDFYKKCFKTNNFFRK